MNGARSTFMRKGYWLTALAAIVLLAASPGTALAQVTIKVAGGGRGRQSVRITVTSSRRGDLSYADDDCRARSPFAWNDAENHGP